MVVVAVQFDYVERITGPTDAQPLALANGVVGQPIVPPQYIATSIHDIAGTHDVLRPILEEAAIVIVGDEAQIHRIMLAGDGQSSFSSDAAHFRLGVIAHREEDIAKFVLPHHTEDVALVLVLVDALEQVHRAIGLAADTGIVTGGKIICPQAASIVEQIVEADVTVAGKARIGCKPLAVAFNKEIHHVLLKRLLDVDQIKWNAQLIGHTAGVVDAFQATTLIG